LFLMPLHWLVNELGILSYFLKSIIFF